MGLTVKRVARIKTPGRYPDGFGLYLQVLSPTNRAWIFRYQFKGRERAMGLGPVHAFTLVEARNRARRARQLLADGIDPLEARRTERTATALAAAKTATFKTCAAGYYDAVSDRWKNAKHRAQFLKTMENDVYPIIGNLAVADIDVGLILRVLQPIWKKKLATASRIRGRIEAVLNWATVRGYRTGDNPARWAGFLSTQLSTRTEKKHFAALPFTELPAFMAALRNAEGVVARALEFTILTAARSGAVTGARWDEIDFKTKTWTVPASRAGAKIAGSAARRVPLSEAAISLLQGLSRDRDNPHIFPGLKPGIGLHVDSMPKVLARLGRREVTVHGFRSCFKDWVSERTNYPNHVSEAALWHSVADKVEAAYRRGDLFEKRRRLMAEWARYCASTPRGEVVPIRRGE